MSMEILCDTQLACDVEFIRVPERVTKHTAVQIARNLARHFRDFSAFQYRRISY